MSAITVPSSIEDTNVKINNKVKDLDNDDYLSKLEFPTDEIE